MLEDTRRFPRINLRAPIRYQIRGEPRSDHSVSENICRGGMSFFCNRFIAPSTPMMLEFSVLSRVLKAIGRVVWSQPLPHSDRNRLGIEFLEIEKPEENYLEDFIKMQMGLL